MRKDSPTVWDSANPTLRAGEIGYAWDSSDSASLGRIKIGDGTSAWTQLAYFYSSGDSAGLYSSGGGSSATWYGDRGLRGGGYAASGGSLLGATNVIDYWDITTTSNSTDFGDLTVARYYPKGASDGTYGTFPGGNDDTGDKDQIDYVTIATTGNATDFGDLTFAKSGMNASCNGTYALYAGGYHSSVTNNIGYYTPATPGNASNFGDLVSTRNDPSSFADATYVLFNGGRSYSGTYLTSMDYVTASTPGNASDFGDLTQARRDCAGASNATIGFTAAGNPGGSSASSPWQRSQTIDYTTIQTPGNATDFGDLTRFTRHSAACANATRGTIIMGYPREGDGSYSISNSIEYITIASPGNATDFGDLSAHGVYSMGSCSGAAS